MLAEHQLPNHTSLTLLARLLFTSLFLLSGVTHFSNVPGYVALMHESIAYRELWVLVSGAVELAGAGMILFNWRPRLGAWLLIIFLLPVTIVVHGYEMLHADGEAMRVVQRASFVKGFALVGAALLMTQIGVTHRSLEPSSN
ncbi:MAG: DoxX family membrane protein [Pseudomonadota bacterium]